MTTAASKATKAESVTQIVVMLGVGLFAAAASFTHVHDVAVGHGQPGWLGWADAIVLELMAPTSGLEMRRRKRMGRPVRMPATVLVASIALSLSAQVVQAESSVPGWLAAALPALAFLVMVKYVLARTVVGVDPATSVATMQVVDPVRVATAPVAEVASPALPAPATPPAEVATKTTPPVAKKTPAKVAKPDTGERVAKLRARRPDITQPEAAKVLAISERTLSRYWAATAPPAAEPAKTNGHAVPDLLPAGSQS